LRPPPLVHARLPQEDLLGGIALELMHLASLYHDDVMDEARSAATSTR